MKSTELPPFSKTANFLTWFCLMLTVVGFSLYAMNKRNYSVFHYLIPTLILVAAVGMKFVAARIPWIQLLFWVIALMAVHFAVELFTTSFPPVYFIGELLMQLICTFLFGRYWTLKGYIPASSNHWPE